MDKNKPKILLFDIETSPNLAWVWGKYEQNVIEYQAEWYMLSFSGKWLGSRSTKTHALSDYKGYKKNKHNDYRLVKDLWNLLNESDIVITHNGDKFDIKKANARFLFHGLAPPKPYKSIDTLKIARKYFKFNSNKLDDLGKYLKLGKKAKHNGFATWLGCMNGDPGAWKSMKRYNKQDVVLLEKVYNKFLPYITNHPNIGLYQGKGCACPNCGKSDRFHKRGFAYTKTSVYQRLQCQGCKSWSKYRKAEKGVKPEVIS